MPRLRTLLASACFALFALSGLGCHRVVVDDVRGPDGGDWKRISCKRMDKKCYSAAAQMCPNGYYFARSAGPAPAVASNVDAAPHPGSGVNVKTLPPQETWGDGMYSKHGGSILVQCAESRASASN